MIGQDYIRNTRMDDLMKMDIKEASTKDLTDELIKREGIKHIVLNPEDEYRGNVEGPAIVIINRD